MTPRLWLVGGVALSAAVAASLLVTLSTTTTPSPASSTPPHITTTHPRPTTTTAPSPPASSWPDASNTGVPAGTTLSAYTGPCTITTANTVIDSKTVNCPDLNIQAGGVSIVKSKVNGHVWSAADTNPAWTVSVTDSEVDGGLVQLPAVGTGNLTVLRSNIHGGETAVQCDDGSVCTVQDSWLHGQAIPPGADWHLGGFLSDGGDHDIRLIHNRVVCDPHPPAWTAAAAATST